ncbi:hypothetical protein G7009_10525 [Pseudomonas capeferrum]|nr:hypothetical protein [Pseudomonas capeferrum]MBA1202187.1 hypothetical protein [Pseudomonas capeferrum]
MKDDRNDARSVFSLAWGLPPVYARRVRRNMLFMTSLLLLTSVLLLMGM